MAQEKLKNVLTTDIDPATRPSTEGLDGSISSEEAERIRQQKLEALEASKKMMAFTPEETPEEQKSTGVAKTVVVGDNDLDVQLSKGELEKVDDKVVVDSNGNPREDYQQMVTQTIDGEEILTFPAMLTNPKIAAPGSLVEFEVRLDTDFVKDQIGDEDPNTWLANGGWKIVPIFIKQGNQVLGLLKAFDETSPKGFQGANREEISKVFLQGGTAVAKVNSKLVDTKSISNAVTEDGETFFYPFTTIKSEGNATSILYVSLDIANNLRWGVAYQGAGPDATDVASSSVKLDKLTPGQIGIVTTNPQGEPIVIIASTRNVTERTANIAIEHITKETPEAFKYSEIVGTSIVPTAEAIINPSNSEMSTSNPEIAGEVSKNLEKFIMTYSLEDGTSMFVFYSPASKSLIRIDEINLKLALLGGKPSFSFVESVMSERGLTTFKTVKVGPELRAAVEMKLGEDFKSVTLQKKMQVDKNKLMLDMEEFESPITGQVYRAGENLPHPYIQYLSSESEFTGDPRQDGKGSNAILTVDTKVNSQGSVFNDVNLRLGPLNAIGVDVTTSEELQSKSVKQTINSISPASTQPSTQPTTTDAKADIERRKNLIGLQDTVDNETNQLISVTATYVRPFNYSELDSVRPVSHGVYIVNNYGEQKSFDIYEYPDPDKAAKEWLDSKYNAELNASEGKTTATPTDIEGKKADIERRRQEELNKNKVEYGGYNLESESIDVDIVQRPDGTFGVVVSLPNKQSSTGFSNSTALSEEFKTRQEALDYVTTAIIPKAEKLINAKYDAELAALEQPATTTPTVVTPTILEGMAKSSDSIEASEIPSEFFRSPGKNSTGNNVSSPNITGFDSLKGLFSDEVPGDILDQINSIPTDLSQFMGKIEDQGSNIEEEC
jgi:hypothetical protein